MSDAQQKAIAIAPKFPAFLSCCGSVYIVQDILRSHGRNLRGGGRSQKDRRRYGPPKTLINSAFYRIMLCLSTVDFMTSIAHFMTTWPIPKEDENSLDNPGGEIVYGNVGNTQTCAVQGFFCQLGIMAPFYNAFLSLYYYLTIRHGWTEEQFKQKMEYMGHFVILSFGFGTAIAGLALELYNSITIWCWMESYPEGCGDGPDQLPCVRGINVGMFRWFFFFLPLWFAFFLVFLFSALLYVHMLRLDQKMDGYTRRYRNQARRTEMGSEPPRRQITLTATNKEFQAAIAQSLFYSIACILPWVFALIHWLLIIDTGSSPWAIWFLQAFFTPVQGFFNCLVYVRPRLIRYFREKRKAQQNAATKPTDSHSKHVTNECTNDGNDEDEDMGAIENQMVNDDESDTPVMEPG